MMNAHTPRGGDFPLLFIICVFKGLITIGTRDRALVLTSIPSMSGSRRPRTSVGMAQSDGARVVSRVEVVFIVIMVAVMMVWTVIVIMIKIMVIIYFSILHKHLTIIQIVGVVSIVGVCWEIR